MIKQLRRPLGAVGLWGLFFVLPLPLLQAGGRTGWAWPGSGSAGAGYGASPVIGWRMTIGLALAAARRKRPA
ncbi:hypothetical protein [Brevundimonas sp. SORGH_AS_0993]|uniref:hypothetical protein n=1 Tax=Brevundimonas sp. SORGH_AS_0993 TaxID=3041794 RepID=UPI0027868594|nr:hypothetical protein [Brevundimonas sp. SORGH_AS_0993]MDQ1154413.1 hypothetical protein [Brevundimonas sp. SORGH_AS_0993]